MKGTKELSTEGERFMEGTFLCVAIDLLEEGLE